MCSYILKKIRIFWYVLEYSRAFWNVLIFAVLEFKALDFEVLEFRGTTFLRYPGWLSDSNQKKPRINKKFYFSFGNSDVLGAIFRIEYITVQNKFCMVSVKIWYKFHTQINNEDINIIINLIWLVLYLHIYFNFQFPETFLQHRQLKFFDKMLPKNI